MNNKAFQRVYTHLDAVTKATVTVRAQGASNDELAMVGDRLAQVVKIEGDKVTLQVFSGTEGLATNVEVAFTGHVPGLKVGEDLAGRFFDAYGRPIDGGAEVEGEWREIGGPSVNPFKRKQPSQLIPTGIAGIDLNNTLVSGQKIPFFADPDQPYNEVMCMVALRAKVDKIILGGMGLSNDDYLFFRHEFEAAGALEKMKPVVVPPMADIFLADQVHRPDQFHSFKVCTVELWHHGLDLTAVKHTHENGFNNIIIVMIVVSTKIYRIICKKFY